MYIIDHAKTIENIFKGNAKILPERLDMTGFCTLVLFDSTGKIKDIRRTKNIETTVGKQKLAAYISAATEAAPFMPYQEIGTKGTTSSTTIAANSVTAGLTFTVGSDVLSAGAGIITLINGGTNEYVGIVSGHSTTYTLPTTTIGSASNAVVLGTNQSIAVASTTGFIDPVASGLGIAYIQIVISGVSQVVSYTSKDSTHFLGCALVGAAAGTLATSQVVNQNPQNAYSGTTTVTPTPLKGDTTNGTAIGARVSGTVTNPGSPSNIYQNLATFSGNTYVGTIFEAGLFDASTSGNMFAHQSFGIINYATGDSLQNTWQVSFP